MKRDPAAVPRLDPSAQLVALPDGRVLVRHAAGITLLSGIALADLRRVLALVDGRRTIQEIETALADVLDETVVRRLLHEVLGEVLRLPSSAPGPASFPEPAQPSHAEPLTAPVLVVGHGPAAARLYEVLTDNGIGAPAFLPVASFASCQSETFLEHERHTLIDAAAASPAEAPGTAPATTVADLEQPMRAVALVVCLLEGLPYRALFDVQEACLRAHVPSLFVTADPDGLRLGPTVVPGVSPCVACAQRANVRFLGEVPGTLHGVLAHLRTQSLDPARFPAVAQAVAAEIRALLTPGGEPALLGRVLRLPHTGSPQRYAIEHAAGCPTCSTVRPTQTATTGQRTDLVTQAALAQLDTLAQRPRVAAPGADEALCRSIGILGGGTAGYLTALALRTRYPHLDVTLIESSRVPVIGVGEATTPLMPQFLHVDLGLDVHDFFRTVQPTFKLGIRFDWGMEGDGTFHYPFGPVRPLDAYTYDGDVRMCSLASMLMEAGALPVWEADGGLRLRLGTEVAYHLENRRFVHYLQQQAAALSIRHIDARIVEVEQAADGETVEALIAEDRRRFAFDLYIDCSGFRSMLLEQTLGSPFVSYAKSLFTDGAVVAAVPHDGHLKPYTVAEAMDAGWCWNTPQREADHRGYVFASAFLSPDDAVREMQRKNPGLGEPRVLRFRPGRHAHFWKGNVVAMGNAYGFVEPLESTALHMLIRQIGLLLRAFPLRRDERSLPALLNRQANAYWDYLAWFLALHYRFNQKPQTPFWQACRADVDVSRHGELIEAFRERGPLSYDRALAAFDYPDPLWGAEGIDLILLGQHTPCRLPQPVQTRAQWMRWRGLCETLVDSAHSQSHALACFDTTPALLDRFVAAFKAVGPAFGRSTVRLPSRSP